MQFLFTLNFTVAIIAFSLLGGQMGGKTKSISFIHYFRRANNLKVKVKKFQNLMIKKMFFSLILMSIILISGCGSKDDDCTKTVQITHYALKNKKFEPYYVMEEVSCDFVAEDIGPLPLKNFTYEVLNFIFIPDTGNKTSRLKFEIKLNNPNNYAVEGLAYITIRPAGDNFEYTGTYSDLASVPCYNIGANSNCILTYDVEYPYNPDVGAPESMEVIKVEYYIAN